MHDMPPRILPEMTNERLLQLLDKYSVPYGEWGTTPGTKTPKDLLGEITAGEAWLIEDGAELMRVTNGLGLDVFAQVDGVRYRLFEAQQEFADGSIRVRHLSTSLGEKIKDGEDTTAVISRALKEELGINLTEVIAYRTGGVEANSRESGSYPGLKTTVILWYAAVELSPDQFKPEGYVEVQPGRKTTYFEWKSN